MSIVIRPATTADAAAIADIYNPYILDTDISFETDPLTSTQMAARIDSIVRAGMPYFVAEDSGSIVGYAYAHAWKDRPAYHRTLETSVYLSAHAVGRGIGRRLMERLIDECRRRGYAVLIACITADNEGSIAFHRALGFEQVSHFAGVGYKHGRTLDVVDLQLPL